MPYFQEVREARKMYWNFCWDREFSVES